MKKEVYNKKRFEHKLNCFEHRLKKIGYPSLSDVIERLKDLFNNQLDFVYDEGDVFEQDCFALRYAIVILETLTENQLLKGVFEDD